MSKTVRVYFLLLVIPALVVPFAAHWILERELVRGREMGHAYLRVQAELVALKATGLDPTVETGAQPPQDGRCCGRAVCANGDTVYTWWKGDVPPGQLRKRHIHGIELTVFAGSLVLFVAGLALLLRSMNDARNDVRRQRAFVADFTHRLKTPLTSISLCAELMRSGRLTPERRTESTDTIVAEAEKLNGIVDEVLGFMEKPRHG